MSAHPHRIPTKESTLQRQVIALLRERGAYVFKVVGSAMQQRGTPDLLVCWRGQFMGLEIKLPGEKPTPMQEHEIGLIRKAGGTAQVIESLEDVLNILSG